MRIYSTLAQPLTSPGGVNYLSGLPYQTFEYTGRFKYHRVTQDQAGRLDIIAWIWYNDCTMYRAIALLNNIIDPISEVVPGMDIAIPVDALSVQNFIGFTYEGT